MAMMFGSQETIHAVAYSYLNETLGLEDYEAFLHEPATAARFDNLVSYDGNDPVGIGKSLAVFSAFAEGVSLYSAFAVLYSFQMRNLLKGIGQQMKWSVRDESLHSKMGCQLFRQMCSQIPGLKEECEPHIFEAALTMHNAEVTYINKIFEMGDIENLTKYDLTHFIKKRLGDKLAELGYTSKKYKQWDFTFYDPKCIKNMSWFDHLTGGHTHTDFFAVRPTDYSKANEGEDFEDIW
jgi:ribonucleoside-diphosphate reductase beta chain